jgi:hypothetical protein
VHHVNKALLGLLQRLVLELDGENPHWSGAVVMQNYGGIPLRSGAAPGKTSGFNLALLGASGRPSHFARCRLPVQPEILAETALLARLAEEPAVRPHLPRAVAGSTPLIAAQLAAFVDGDRFTRLVPGATPARLLRDTGDILGIAERIGVVADRDMPREPVALSVVSAPLVEEARRIGLEPARATAVERLLVMAGSVPAASQHGDLWPPNVLKHGGTWVLLDFEHFGRLRVPLVDAVQLVRSTRALRWPGTGSWIGGLAGAAPDAGYSRAILGAAQRRAGLTRVAAAGCVTFALLEIIARFTIVGRPPVDWMPALDELRALADLATDPSTAADLLFGAET